MNTARSAADSSTISSSETRTPLQQPTLYLVYVSRKHLPLKIRAFIDFMLEWGSKVQVPKLAASR